MENHRKEVSFISQSIIYSVLLGIIVGIAAGLVVVVFRLAIEKLFGVFSHLYPLATDNPIYLLLIGGLYLVIALLVGHLIKYEPNAKGSGIPQVEAELKGFKLVVSSLEKIYRWRFIHCIGLNAGSRRSQYSTRCSNS